MKVYPAMDLLGGRIVRLREGRYDQVTTYAGDPVDVARTFVEAGCERVHIVDLDGARDGAPTQADLVRRLLESLPVRVQVGGGIRSMAQLEAYVKAGADRVVLGTIAVRDPEFLREACRAHRIVVAVDAVDGNVAIKGWSETSEVRAVDLAKRAQQLGAAAVLYTDIRRDGTGAGPNVDATATLADAVPGLEVIASGGVATAEHVRSLAACSQIGACVIGRALYEGSLTVTEAVAAARG